jgi:hypothetical protein
MLWLVATIQLVTLTGPNGQRIEVNANEIVSVRQPRSSDHFAIGTHCLINTTDRNAVAVQETCEAVLKIIEERKK